MEVGARMHGLKGPKMTELATGFGMHELAVDVFVECRSRTPQPAQLHTAHKGREGHWISPSLRWDCIGL